MDSIQPLIEKLKSFEIGCEDKFLDFKALKFDTVENEMKLYNDFREYYFKSDPKNPKSPKVTHGLTQFCRFMGVPYSFFAKNPEYMRKSMVDCWLPTLKAENSSVLGKLRRKDQKLFVRALLPVEHTNITNSQIMEALSREALDDFQIAFAIGDDEDDLILHVRFIGKEEFEVCGEKCSIGFSVICSELGAVPFSVDTLLYRKGTVNTAFVASYNNESFFLFDYSKIQKTDLQSMFPPLMVHLKDKLGEIKQKIQEAKETLQKRENIFDMLNRLKLSKGLNDKFHTLLFQEVDKNDTIRTTWDFASKVALVATNFPVEKRLKIEKEAGRLLKLEFEKS